MRIQRLELFGFKSFPDRTSFEFGSGISGVVGPNGSGKSNVVDALRWVIGEQSARSLRGKDMVDVIFAGSATRSPVGFAEVSLTLSSADGEPFPGDLARFEEVEVGRRLYRDGTSEYLLNKVKCRRRDIVDLFMDTGVGSNLYSFIAQGQVDRIVSQSAQERRSLIDEAAGISRYKVRRDEALTRLAATGTQLDRASDVADEMGRRLRALEKQVIAAGRFRRFRAALRQREIALGVVKYAALSGDRRALRERYRRVQQETSALRRSVDRVEEELQVRQAEVDSVAEAVSTWRDQAAELEAQRREAEGARTLHQRRQVELHQAAARATGRSAEVLERAAASASESEALASRLHTVEEQLQRNPEDSSAVLEAEATLATASATVARLAEQAARVEAERAALTEQLTEVEEVVAPEEIEATEPDRSGLEAAQKAREDGATALKGADAVLREQRAEMERTRSQIDTERRVYRASLGAWQQARAANERASIERDRWLRRTTAALERARREIGERARSSVERRSADWIRAIREHRDHVEAQIRSTAASIRTSRDGAAWGLDFGSALDATLSLEGSRLDVQARHEAWDEARDAHARLRGKAAALDAEFGELERQRREGLPDTWVEKPTLGDQLDPDDPIRAARPDLLGLPMLELADLHEASGRGVLDIVRSWTRVPEVADAIEHLRAGGGPVVTTDGRLRVDADGMVQLGASSSRWEAARRELGQARSEELEARRDTAEAKRLLALAAAAIQAAEGLVQAEEEALDAKLEHAKSQREIRLERVVEAWSRTAEEGLQEARRAPVPFTPVEGPIARAWAMRRPPGIGERPEFDEPSVDLDGVRAAEAGVDGARRVLTQATRTLEHERATVAEAERQAALRLDRFEVANHAAQTAARRAVELRQRIGLLGEVEGRVEAEEALEGARERHRSEVAKLSERRQVALELRELRARLIAEREGHDRSIQRAELDASSAREEAKEAKTQAERALEQMERSQEACSTLAGQRAQVLERLERDRGRLQKLKGQAAALQSTLSGNRDSFTRGELEEKDLSQRVEQLQLDIEGLRKGLGDRYQVSLPGLLDRLKMRRSLTLESEGAVAEVLEVGDVRLEPVEPMEIGVRLLDDEERVVEMVGEIDKLRAVLARVGDVNLAAEEEYRDLHTRYQDLHEQRTDLEESVASIRSAIAKMNRACRTRFRDAYDRVNEAFQLSYPKLVGGGDARLALTNDEDLLETGVDIFVRPPGKRLQNLTLLSGGEKAMTAIALLLALFKVRPSPFCVLDEVDAPLDEANGARFNEMVREMSSQSQFIVVTHNRKTMECVDVLYGVTMADPGVSKLVSVALS